MEAKQFRPLKLQPKQRTQESRSTGKVRGPEQPAGHFPQTKAISGEMRLPPKKGPLIILSFPFLLPKSLGNCFN